MSHRHVENLIGKLGRDAVSQRAMADVEYIVMHMFGSHELEWYDEHRIQPTAKGVARFYKQNREACAATGGVMPYPLVVGLGGSMWQARRLADVAPHAKRFNRVGLGVAFLGNFNLLPPTKDQWNAGVDLCAALTRMWPHLRIVGHTELGSEATSDARKNCPGRLFDVRDFAAEVAAVNQATAGMELIEMGVQVR